MNSFLIIFLIVSGYFVLLSFVAARLDRSWSVSTIAAIVLLIYGCIVGMLAVLGYYLGELGLLLYAAAIVYSGLFWGVKIYSSIKKKPQIQLGVLVMLIAYILAVLYITVFMRGQGTNFQVQMEVLNWVQEDGIETFDHILLNVAMFVPIGVLFPFVTDNSHGKLVSAFSFGMLFSVLIETGQLILHSGTCDIDDIIANSLGAFLGALMITVGLKINKKNKNFK